MLFRELTKTFGNQLMTAIDIEECESFVFGGPALEPKIKLVQDKITNLVTCFCQTENTPTCNICNGTKRIQQNGAFLKFLNAVIDYKIGRSQNSSQKIKPLQEIKPKQEEVKPKVFWKEQKTITKNVAMSLQMNYKNQIFAVQQARLACSAPIVTHKGVECDGCKAYPLIGTRFQCTKCESYDLCAFCYNSCGSQHEHSFRRVDFPKNEIIKRTLKQQFKKAKSYQRIVQ